MLKYIVDELCVNAVGVFVVGNAASEAYPCLLKGTRFEDDGVLNNNVSHTCKVKRAGCHRTEQAAWINESVKALTLVVDKMNPIRSEVILDRDEIVYVHPNKERAEEYSHLPLEQCKRVYEDLVNQYKSLAKKIDETIHWRELDNTANQLSAERHKLNNRLQELERVRVAKRDKEEREEKEERVIRQKIEGGKEITIYVNAWAIDRKLGHIKLVVNSRDSILRVKSMIESVVRLTTHEMIISNASDEEMSDEKSLDMCKVAMGTFVIIKRRSC
jgi:hypothetical protein